MKFKTTSIAAIFIGVTMLTQAQNGPPGPPPDPVGMELDKDHDQQLTAREIRDASKSLLKLDKNKDKALSAEELRPEPPREQRKSRKDKEEAPQAPPPTRLLATLDTDSNGDLSEVEITKASDALLKLDADGNGKLSSEEAGLMRPPMGPPQGGPGGPPPGGPGGPPPGGPRR